MFQCLTPRELMTLKGRHNCNGHLVGRKRLPKTLTVTVCRSVVTHLYANTAQSRPAELLKRVQPVVLFDITPQDDSSLSKDNQKRERYLIVTGVRETVLDAAVVVEASPKSFFISLRLASRRRDRPNLETGLRVNRYGIELGSNGGDFRNERPAVFSVLFLDKREYPLEFICVFVSFVVS